MFIKTNIYTILYIYLHGKEKENAKIRPESSSDWRTFYNNVNTRQFETMLYILNFEKLYHVKDNRPENINWNINSLGLM